MEQLKRIVYWDNFKGFLIFLVVFTHFLYNFTGLDYGKYIVNVIYFFHMPAFIFISGYFSKKEINFQKACKYLLIYLIFNTVFVLYTLFTSGTLLGLTPFFSYWYLLALVAWRVIARYLPCNTWYIVIPVSFVISLFSGFCSDVSNVLAIEKILGFLPFFFIGYYLPKNFIVSFTQKRKKWVFFAGFIIFVFALLSAVFISYSYDIQNYLLMEPYHHFIDVLIRALVYIIALVASFGLFCMIPNKGGKYNFVQKWGRNSLWIYVFHRPITLVFAKIYPGPDNLYILASFVISLVVCFLFGSDKLNKFLNKYLDKIINKLDNMRIKTHSMQSIPSASKIENEKS